MNSSVVIGPSRLLITFVFIAIVSGCSSSNSNVGNEAAQPEAENHSATVAPSIAAPPTMQPAIAPPPAGQTANDGSTGGMNARGTVRAADVVSSTGAAGSDSGPVDGEAAAGAATILAAEITFTNYATNRSVSLPIDVTPDGGVALVDTAPFRPASPRPGAPPEFPVDATISWLDYRDGVRHTRRAIIEGPDVVRMTDAPASPPVAPGPISPTGAISATGPTTAAGPTSGANRAKSKVLTGQPVDVRLDLEGPVDDVVAGGGGRYLLLSVPSKREIVVVDLRDMKVARTITASDDFLVAAGATRFVVLNRKTRSFARYRFDTFEVDQRSSPLGLAMPAAAGMSEFGEGPIWFLEEANTGKPATGAARSKPAAGDSAKLPVRLIDLERLAPMAAGYEFTPANSWQLSGPYMRRGVSVSAAGDRCCIPTVNSSPILLQLVDGKIAVVKAPGFASGPTVRQGSLSARLFDGGKVYLADVRTTLDDGYDLIVPYSPGDSCFAVDVKSPTTSVNGVREPGETVFKFFPDISQPARSLIRLEEIGNLVYEALHEHDPNPPSLSRRLHYSAAEKVIAFVGGKPERVFLKRFDVESPDFQLFNQPAPKPPKATEVAAGGTPTDPPPASTAPPPEIFTRGKKFERQIAPPGAAGAKYSIVSGPPGMTVSDAGLVEWTPAATVRDRYAAIIGIDLPGRLSYHVLQLAAADYAPAPADKNRRQQMSTSAKAPVPDKFAVASPEGVTAYRIRSQRYAGANLPPVRPLRNDGKLYVPPHAAGVSTRGSQRLYRGKDANVLGEPGPIRKPFKVFGMKTTTAGAPAPVDRFVGAETPDLLLPLPGPVTDVVPAGDGRYLLVSMHSLRHVALFDVREAKLTTFIDAESDDFVVAGGKTRFVLYDRATRKIRRGNLATGAIEKEAVLPERNRMVEAMAMGAGSEGPVYFLGDLTHVPRECELKMLDLETLSPRDLTTTAKRFWGGTGFESLSVSADGRHVATGQPHDIHQLLEIEGTEVKQLKVFTSINGSAVIDREGQGILSGPTKMLLPDVTLTTGKGRGMISADAMEGSYWYTASLRREPGEWDVLPIQFFAGTETTPLVSVLLGGISTSDSSWVPGWNRPAVARSVYYCLPEKTLAVVAQSPPRIAVKRFDLRAAVKSSAPDVLSVASRPPLEFPKQPNLTYQLETISKYGGATYRLEAGPADMTISPEGLVAWHGPTEGKSFPRPVVIAVSDASGKATKHTFTVPSSSFEAAPALAVTAPSAPPPSAPLPSPSRPTAGSPAGTAPAAGAVAARVVNLPGQAAAVVGAGDGRYMLFAFPQLRKIALFDLRGGEALRYVDVASSRFLVAAGLTRFVVFDQEKNVISCYRLETGELEKTKPYLPGKRDVVAATIGIASEGPLILWDAEDLPGHATPLRFVDLEKLTVRKVDVTNPQSLLAFENKLIHHLTASADGKTFAVVKAHDLMSNVGSFSAVFAQGGGKIAFLDNAHGDYYTYLSSNGGSLFSHSSRDYPGDDNVHFYSSSFTVRSCHADGLWLSYKSGSKSRALKVLFHAGQNEKTLASVTIDYPVVDHESEYPSKIAERSHYSDPEKTLAIVRTNPDQLLLYRFDAAAAIAASGTEYLAFTSSPPLIFPPGGKLTYRAKAASSVPDVRHRLESGPAGMTVSPEGLLEWKVPASCRPTEEVIVAASSVSGEVKQKFKMRAEIAATIIAGSDAQSNSALSSVMVALPGKSESVAVGARGKYLLAAIGSTRSVAVVDVQQRKIVKTLPIEDDRLRIAAGATKFVVYCGSTRQLHRYDFATLERDLSVSLDHDPADIALGGFSEGPVATIHPQDGMRLLNLQTLRPLVLDAAGPTGSQSLSGDRLFASPDGRRFARRYATADAESTYEVLFFDGAGIKSLWSTKKVSLARFSADGSVLHTSNGRYDLRGKHLWTDNSREPAPCIPAAAGDYYISWRWGSQFATGGNYPLELFAGGVDRPLATTFIPPPEYPKGVGQIDHLWNMRYLFFPGADAIVSIPPSDDQLVIHRLNVDELLREVGRDYLFAASSPPTIAAVGESYRYQIEVKSRNGDVTIDLEKKPEGMTISSTGLIEWQVPAGARSAQAEAVVVRLKDSAGNEARQSFEIETVTGLPPEMRPRQVVQLEGPYNRAFVGGGGRYVVPYFSKLKKVGVVDLVTRKVVGYVALDEEPRIAVGRDKFVVCLPSKKTFVRYDLATCKQEQSTVFPAMGDVHGMIMGCDSAGPILLNHDSANTDGRRTQPFEFIDLATLAPKKVKVVDPNPDWPSGAAAWYASADGRLFSNVERQLLIRLEGDTALLVHPDDFGGSGPKVPDGDGEALYGYGVAVTVGGEKLTEADNPQGISPPRKYPAARGPLVLGIRGDGFGRGGGGRPRAAVQIPADVFVRGDARSQLRMIDVEGLQGDSDPVPYVVQYDFFKPLMRERIFFAPHLKLLATVPDTHDRIVVHDFDFDEELKRRTDEYLFVYAAAPAPVEPSEPWTHQLDVRSQHGGLSYRIDKGPPGAMVSSTGLISWTPPAAAAVLQPIVVVVRDATGRELSHTVRPRARFDGPSDALPAPPKASPSGSPVAAPSGSATGSRPAPEYRTWSSGQFSVTAAFVELRGDLVVLRAADGHIMEVPLEKLSPTDQAYARSAAKKP